MALLGYSNTEDPGSTGEIAHNVGIKESALSSIAHSRDFPAGAVTLLYLTHKAGHISAAYGALGTALVLLLWLYLLSGLIVASAFLNATLWERQAREAPDT